MDIIISIIVFIIVFSALILVHEFGHYWMARRAGIRVDEFGFGLPPRIWGRKKGDTLYSINWIPFGGFVRLFGEDPTDPKALKAKDSFINKTLLQRTKVVCGGVAMNFLLAWVLLLIGLVVGIEPLIVSYDQFKESVENGNISLSPYYVVKEDYKAFDINHGDHILSIDSKSIEDIVDLNSYVESLDEDVLNIDVEVEHFNHLESPLYYTDTESQIVVHTIPITDMENLTMYSLSRVPRISLLNDVQLLKLKKDDVLLRVNEREVLGKDAFFEVLYSEKIHSIDVSRAGKFVTLNPEVGFVKTRVDKVVDGSPASKAGVKSGDFFSAIENHKVYGADEVIAFAKNADKELKYLFDRNGEMVDISITPENGLIGVVLSPVIQTEGLDIALYERLSFSSVLDIKKQKASVLAAPFVALYEIKNVSLITAKMTTGVFYNVFKTGKVPEGVAGPVGIAQMTYLSVQQGFIDVLRFAAILSLSLGVLNILPFPALDGGRFVFIIFEFFTGKRLDARFEAMIHAIGFTLLLVLIAFITWNDILNLI